MCCDHHWSGQLQLADVISRNEFTVSSSKNWLSLTLPSMPSRMLSLLMSRWITLFSWRNSNAWRHCAQTHSQIHRNIQTQSCTETQRATQSRTQIQREIDRRKDKTRRSASADFTALCLWNVHSSCWGSMPLGPNFTGAQSSRAKMLIPFDR